MKSRNWTNNGGANKLNTTTTKLAGCSNRNPWNNPQKASFLGGRHCPAQSNMSFMVQGCKLLYLFSFTPYLSHTSPWMMLHLKDDNDNDNDNDENTNSYCFFTVEKNKIYKVKNKYTSQMVVVNTIMWYRIFIWFFGNLW